ncbi:MAG: efflux RND transporter periplasmic adaptor subunit [Rickettsiales bacterium]|nr:efflux RND transporter periplasmic adaptor subunit [Rickettsiales bacterium]
MIKIFKKIEKLEEKIFAKKILEKKFLCLIAIVVMALIYFTIDFFNQKNAAKISYNESKAEISALHIKILATGNVQPENRLEIKPPIPGRIEQVLIKEGDYVKKGQILAWMSSVERAALLDAARAKGVEELKKWQKIYPPTPILAPLNGTIVLKNVEQGETFTNVDSLMSMSDRLTVKAQVDETDIASVQLNQEAEIILDAYPNQKIPAKVDKIAFDATTINNVTTYIVDVLPKTVPEFMRSGMTANVTFLLDSKNDVLLIPNDALFMKDGKAKVLVRQDDKEIEKEVISGATDGKKIEILSGLTAGEIILSPQLKIEKTKNNSNPFNPMGSRGIRR